MTDNFPVTTLLALYDPDAIGIRTLASMAKDSLGHPVNQVFFKNLFPANFPYTHNEFELLVSLIKDLNTDLLGISIRSSSLKTGMEIVSRLRQEMKDIKIIIGGTHAILSPEECMASADMVCLGEGEYPFLDLLRGFSDDLSAVKDVPGLWVKSGGHIYKNRMNELIDIDKLPAIDYSDGNKWYIENDLVSSGDPLSGNSVGEIFSSRGCPYNCDFCNVTVMLGHRPRLKSAGQIIAELDALYKIGWRESVFFVDDNLIGNKRMLKESLLPALIEWRKDKVGMTFHTEASINLADDEELMLLMSEAGFDMVFIGIETPSEESLAECGKKHNKNRDLIEDVKRIQRHGMQVQGGFIIGFDSDTPSIFQRQIEFIQKSGIVTAMVGLLQAPLGTRLYQRLAQEGRLLGAFSGDNVDGMTNIIPKMNLQVLHKGYQTVIRSLYAPANYYARVKTFLREYKPSKISVPLNFEHILAFFRSILRLGILGQARLEYWKFFFWALFRRPRLFPLAITFAIYGYHFRQVCDLHVL